MLKGVPRAAGKPPVGAFPAAVSVEVAEALGK